MIEEQVLETLKEDINNFLWVRLPEKTTMGEAEKIAVEIYDLVRAECENKDD